MASLQSCSQAKVQCICKTCPSFILHGDLNLELLEPGLTPVPDADLHLCCMLAARAKDAGSSPRVSHAQKTGLFNSFSCLFCCCLCSGDCPCWVPLVCAAAVVIYTWLDCLDGKQARRTGSSSPLGQLFDHGCDALSVNLLLANIACSMGIGCGWASALGNLGVSGY